MPLHFDSEEFQVWRDHPVTQTFFAFLAKEGAAAKANWAGAAWEGKLDPVQHAATHGACNAIHQILNITWEDISHESADQSKRS
jgi:hypothetical protein